MRIILILFALFLFSCSKDCDQTKVTLTNKTDNKLSVKMYKDVHNLKSNKSKVILFKSNKTHWLKYNNKIDSIPVTCNPNEFLLY